ncbi:C4-dicarboxylate ABC transporter permease [Agaricicola taiwanensis]|uniref:C4-dicarboxylate ABC transporter permease n=1 Tax=Agaricicola taiwanensis TaxID=591372 RepID=A0A8J2YLQ6_9RHOB|nr:TRAP transporter large permease [Agaricicola taiwanensis]GGE51393.1 C4-dicarboxylate ABC transporter permease [Agaricicola taiwanensis]
MDPFTIACVSIVVMLLLMAIGLPVAVAMIAVSAVGMYAAAGSGFMMTTFRTLPFATASSYTFAAIPMFVAMGVIAGASGIISDIYRSADMWLARVRGGLFMATTLASAGFGAINGSTIVGAALFTRIALPEMVKLGYDRAASAGCIAAAGTFAAMIPPSITMVLYGVLTNESIGQILIAGILPGLLTAAVYLVGIGIFVRIWPDWAPPSDRRFPLGQRIRSLSTVWPIAVIAFIVVGGIYSGLVSPSAAGAVGAVGALVVVLLMRRMTTQTLVQGMSEAATTTAVMFFIVIGGLAFSRLLLVTGFVGDILSGIETLALPAWVLFLALVAVYLVLGMLMDPISMMVMTVPIVHPIVTGLGYDPIWFAIIMVKLIELSCITPPVGLNLFVVAGAGKGLVTTQQVYKGVIPFVILELITLGLLIAFPQITLWLPQFMMG